MEKIMNGQLENQPLNFEDFAELNRKYPNNDYFKNAVVFTPKRPFRATAMQVLSDLGIEEGYGPQTVKDCKRILDEYPRAPLIIDWFAGKKTIVKILTHVKAHEKDAVRPILLVAKNLNEEVASLAMEYGVSRIYGGKVTPENLTENLLAMKLIDLSSLKISNKLTEIAAAKQKGEIAEACELVSKLYTQQSRNMRVIVEYAEMLIEQDEWAEAESRLEPLIKAEPPYLRALSAYGRCLMKRGEFKKATEVLKSGNVVNPFNVDRLVALGQVLIRQKKYREAEIAFEDALDIQSDHREALIGKASCQLVTRDVNDVLSILKEVKDGRELASIFNAAAIFSIQDHHFEKGLSLYDMGIDMVGHDYPAQSKLYFNRGVALFKWGKPKEALKYFELACQIDPDFKKAKHNFYALSQGAPTARNFDATWEDHVLESAMQGQQADADLFQDESLRKIN